MKILVYDPFSGISGDMHMGAMVDLGVPQDYLLEALGALRLPGWKVVFKREKRKGIEGTRAVVSIEGEAGGSKAAAADDEVHNHHHGDPHEHPHTHSHDHSHRGIREIREIVEGSGLDPVIKRRSMAMFELIARAEAKVHGMPVEKVHFHEVGAVDSIVDIVAAAAAIEYLQPDRIVSHPPELGGGFVRCAHGRIPVPAPATVEILEGVPCRRGAVDKETTTPTGAAILKANANEFIETASYTVKKTGYGVGSRDTEIPNVLRVFLAEEREASLRLGAETVDAQILECNIDDMSPELYDYVLEILFRAGAKDAFLGPVQMKKNRPGTLLTVMTTEEKKSEMLSIIFEETTTAGIREYPVRQHMLKRDYEKGETPYGEIRLKCLYLRGRCISRKPEYEEAKALAERHGVSLREIYRSLPG